MEYEKIQDKICQFEMYVKQSMDLLKDSYRWRVMAEECDDEEMKTKYMNVSNTLFELFMVEHNNIGDMFKKQQCAIIY